MKDVTQIRVGKNQIGIMGLKEVLVDMTENHRDLPDEEISKLLLERLFKKNYIIEHFNEEYARAFLRIQETRWKAICGGACRRDTD